MECWQTVGEGQSEVDLGVATGAPFALVSRRWPTDKRNVCQGQRRTASTKDEDPSIILWRNQQNPKGTILQSRSGNSQQAGAIHYSSTTLPIQSSHPQFQTYHVMDIETGLERSSLSFASIQSIALLEMHVHAFLLMPEFFSVSYMCVGGQCQYSGHETIIPWDEAWPLTSQLWSEQRVSGQLSTPLLVHKLATCVYVTLVSLHMHMPGQRETSVMSFRFPRDGRRRDAPVSILYGGWWAVLWGENCFTFDG
ncbi:hypothetical protein CBL_10968 [Carabus blaptoides fortunei]